MSTSAKGPDTIVLIHGFWVTPRSWEEWIAHYEARGYTVIAPAYPGFEIEVEALNAVTAAVVALRVSAIIDRLESLIEPLDGPPILMGHSAGGAFMQVVMDHGYGAAGVAMNSAPTEGVRAVPLAQVKSTFPVLKNPANHNRAVPFTYEQWHYAFTNTSFSEEEVPEALRAVRGPGVGTDPVEQRAGEPGAGAPGRLGQLQESGSCPVAVHFG